jgi:hypothetical protein
MVMAKKESNLTLGISETEKVDEYIKNLDHPLSDVVQYIRKVIMSIDKSIGEGIYWNAPTFYFTGEMKPFEAKEYKRYLAGFVFNRKDSIRMVFLQGANVDNKDGLLEGDYKDGRRLAEFTGMGDAKNKEKALKQVIRELLKVMK